MCSAHARRASQREVLEITEEIGFWRATVAAKSLRQQSVVTSTSGPTERPSVLHRSATPMQVDMVADSAGSRRNDPYRVGDLEGMTSEADRFGSVDERVPLPQRHDRRPGAADERGQTRVRNSCTRFHESDISSARYRWWSTSWVASSNRSGRRARAWTSNAARPRFMVASPCGTVSGSAPRADLVATESSVV